MKVLIEALKGVKEQEVGVEVRAAKVEVEGGRSLMMDRLGRFLPLQLQD